MNFNDSIEICQVKYCNMGNYFIICICYSNFIVIVISIIMCSSDDIMCGNMLVYLVFEACYKCI